jgi:hypothetical protein
VEWLKLKALSSNPSTTKEKQMSENHIIKVGHTTEHWRKRILLSDICKCLAKFYSVDPLTMPSLGKSPKEIFKRIYSRDMRYVNVT